MIENTTKKRLFISYGILFLGMPLLFILLFFLVPDKPGYGWTVYTIPIICFVAYLVSLCFSGMIFSYIFVHALIGIVLTPILAFLNFLFFGFVLIAFTGLKGIQ